MVSLNTKQILTYLKYNLMLEHSFHTLNFLFVVLKELQCCTLLVTIYQNDFFFHFVTASLSTSIAPHICTYYKVEQHIFNSSIVFLIKKLEEKWRQLEQKKITDIHFHNCCRLMAVQYSIIKQSQICNYGNQIFQDRANKNFKFYLNISLLVSNIICGKDA